MDTTLRADTIVYSRASWNPRNNSTTVVVVVVLFRTLSLDDVLFPRSLKQVLDKPLMRYYSSSPLRDLKANII
jgi:hypothetical protein